MCLLAVGFLARLAQARSAFLNPDEALHYLLSVQPSLALTYRATLTTAHPPLLIVFLHYWSALGTSEWILRLPSVVAGTAFCWVVFLWLKLVTDRTTALIALSLLLFSPALIYLSAEIRQYALVQFFAAFSLYFLERGVGERSPCLMLSSALALYLALLSHYSALLVALTLGVYGLARMRQAKSPAGVVAAWGIGEAGALAIVGFQMVTHVSMLKARGAPQGIANSYLRPSIYHRGEDHALLFVAKNSLRFFHYLFSQGAVGAVALLLFIVGIVFLVRDRRPTQGETQPSARLLGLLLAFPLVLNCGLALFAIYPFGGTHHNSYLAGFAMAGIAVALERWNIRWSWVKPLSIGVVLALCNLFSSPTGGYIPAKDQDRMLMQQAVQSLQSLPTGSIIFTDYQGALLLSYYFCPGLVTQVPCGPYRVISISPSEWTFRADTFANLLLAMQRTQALPSGSKVWVFRAGWLTDDEQGLQAALSRCRSGDQQRWGRNISLSPIVLP
jgi:4-amino-4-deoxy-L-arabinose transferase-like glycosyltransferase